MTRLYKYILTAIGLAFALFCAFYVGYSTAESKAQSDQYVLFSNLQGEQIKQLSGLLDKAENTSLQELRVELFTSAIDDFGCASWLESIESEPASRISAFVNGANIALTGLAVSGPLNNECRSKLESFVTRKAQ